MKDQKRITPLIRKGWLRVIIFCVSLLLLTSLIYLIVIFYFFKDTKYLSIISSGITSNNVLLLIPSFSGLLLAITFRRQIDRKSIVSLGLETNDRLHDALAGLGLSLQIIASATLILYFLGFLKWTDIIYDPKRLFISLGTVLIIAFSKELVYRGYILNNLMESMSKWIALGTSSILFMFVESFGPNAGFFTWINTLVLGLILGINFIYTRNLWFSILFHAGWVFTQNPLLGYTSNTNSSTLLQIELEGNQNMNGGASGLQGSLLLFIASIIGLFLLYLSLQKKFRKQSLQAPGQI